MHSSGRDDETDKKNLAVYVPLVMGIGFACLAIVCIVWAIQKKEEDPNARNGVKKLSKGFAASTGATAADNQDEKRQNMRVNMVV